MRGSVNLAWQRDLVVSHVKLGMATGDQEHLTRALAIARAMQACGVLAPRDAWMIDDLERRAAPPERAFP